MAAIAAFAKIFLVLDCFSFPSTCSHCQLPRFVLVLHSLPLPCTLFKLSVCAFTSTQTTIEATKSLMSSIVQRMWYVAFFPFVKLFAYSSPCHLFLLLHHSSHMLKQKRSFFHLPCHSNAHG